MQHNLDHTIQLLARTPATLDALLRDLPQTWTSGTKVKTPGARSMSSAI